MIALVETFAAISRKVYFTKLLRRNFHRIYMYPQHLICAYLNEVDVNGYSDFTTAEIFSLKFSNRTFMVIAVYIIYFYCCFHCFLYLVFYAIVTIKQANLVVRSFKIFMTA